jgi:hypothetical protein
MSGPPEPPPAASPGRSFRVEYLDFQNVAEYREYRFRVCGPGASTEARLRIATVAFGAGRLRLQDGPDVCYQKLIRAVAAGEAAGADVMTVDDADLASYREAHTPVARHRSFTPPSSPPEAVVPRRPPRMLLPKLPVAPPVVKDPEPVFEEGQRVSHAVFGEGVTTSSGGGHTVVSFDQDGPKTFITSMLKMDVLSAAHTWETSPRGKNRPCRPPSPPTDPGSSK